MTNSLHTGPTPGAHGAEGSGSEPGSILGMGVVLADRGEAADASDLAVRAVDAACAEAGIGRTAVDGLLINQNVVTADDHVSLELARRGGFGPLRVLYELEAKGTTMAVLVHQAAREVEDGRARYIAVVFSDASVQPGRRSGSAFTSIGGNVGTRGLETANGLLGAPASYAKFARYYQQERGAAEEDLFAVARAQRQWATMNPLAMARTPLTDEEYWASPLVAAPLRRLDCARPVSGAVAFVIGRAEDVGGGAPRPVFIRALSQRYALRRMHGPGSPWRPFGVADTFEESLRQGRRTRDDLAALQIYDPFTIVPLVMLEELGYADPGKAGAFIRAGHTSPGGAVPVNTGGGQVSGFYLQGATPLVEAVTQLRGQAGQRQVPGAEDMMVVAIGGRLEAVASLLLGVTP